jgi:protein-tyrosine kinase
MSSTIMRSTTSLTLPGKLAGSLNTVHGERSIGAILVQAGRLTTADAERVVQLQREQGFRFGEAAVQLGLLTQSDIEFALSRQFDCQYLTRGDSQVSESVINAYAPFSTQGQTLSALRSQIALRWLNIDPTHKALAILSADRNEGRSFIASNLAVSFSQLGLRTLLIDADMRNPSQHALFGLENRFGLSALLSGRGRPDEVIQAIPGLHRMSVLPSGILPPNPLELLERPLFSRLLTDLAGEFDVLILDSPSATEYPDGQSIALNAGAALIVVRKNYTRMWQVRGVSESITNTSASASASVIGTVLNAF